MSSLLDSSNLAIKNYPKVTAMAAGTKLQVCKLFNIIKNELVNYHAFEVLVNDGHLRATSEVPVTVNDVPSPPSKKSGGGAGSLFYLLSI